MGTPNTGPVSRTALESASADETLGYQIDMANYVNGTFYIVPTGTVTSGIVSIEESAVPGYAGSWSVIVSSAAISTDSQQAVHLNMSEASYKWVRARISTVIGGGGTVKVYFQGN